MSNRASLAEQILPIAVAIAGVCMTALSISLLISSARLGDFMHKMLGFIGVIFVNSLILSFVAIRIAISKEDEATPGEKVFILGLSLCTGTALVIAYTSGL